MEHEDYGIPLTKKETAFVIVILATAFTCWIAVVSAIVYKCLQVA